jgi:hypothetical protein
MDTLDPTLFDGFGDLENGSALPANDFETDAFAVDASFQPNPALDQDIMELFGAQDMHVGWPSQICNNLLQDASAGAPEHQQVVDVTPEKK